MYLTLIQAPSKYAFMDVALPKRIEYWSRSGCTVQVLQYGSPYFLEKLEELDQEKTHVIFWGHFFNILTKINDKKNRLIPNLSSTSLGLVGDHPYASWMQDKLFNAKDITLIGREPGYEKPLKLMCSPNVKYKTIHASTFPIDIQALPPSEKFIDFLVPMDFRLNCKNLNELWQALRHTAISKRAFMRIFHEMMRDKETYPFDLFCALVNDLGYDLSDLIEDIGIRAFLSILHDLDMIIRSERRIEILKQAISLNPKRDFFILASPHSKLPLGGNIHYLGNQTYDQYRKLLQHSKCLLFSSPTYPSIINERIFEATCTQTHVMCDMPSTLLTTNSEINFAVSNELPSYQPNTSHPEVIKYLSSMPSVEEAQLNIFQAALQKNMEKV